MSTDSKHGPIRMHPHSLLAPDTTLLTLNHMPGVASNHKRKVRDIAGKVWLPNGDTASIKATRQWRNSLHIGIFRTLDHQTWMKSSRKTLSKPIRYKAHDEWRVNLPWLIIIKKHTPHLVTWLRPRGLPVDSRGLRRLPSLDCWDCWFESRQEHLCLSLVSVVCCQVEVSATGRSPVQRNPTDNGASLCVI